MREALVLLTLFLGGCTELSDSFSPTDQETASDCGVSVAQLERVRSEVKRLAPYQGKELGKCSFAVDDAHNVLVITPEIRRSVENMIPRENVEASGWAVECRAGQDGFASNCTAERKLGDFTLRQSTGDDQVFVQIIHPNCDDGYRNFDRTDFIGLEPSKRRVAVGEAFKEIVKEASGTCPGIARPELELGDMPDIAVLDPKLDI